MSLKTEMIIWCQIFVGLIFWEFFPREVKDIIT